MWGLCRKCPFFHMQNATWICESGVWFQGRSVVPQNIILCGCIYRMCDMCCIARSTAAQLWREKGNQINSYWKFKISTHIGLIHVNVMVKINILSKFIGVQSTTWQQTSCCMTICLRHIVSSWLRTYSMRIPHPVFFFIWLAYWRWPCSFKLLHNSSKISRNKIFLEIKLKMMQLREQWCDRQLSDHIPFFVLILWLTRCKMQSFVQPIHSLIRRD